MATSVGTAYVDIQANTTNFEKQLETSVNGALKGAGEAAQKFGRMSDESLMGLSKSLTSVGTNLTKKVTLPLVAVGAGALLTAGNFEQGMNKVRAITGATEGEIGKLSEQAKELGSSTKFSATEAANAMSFLGMAGFDTSQILGAMPGTLQLAAAANMGLAEAADITSNVLSGFGIEVDQLGSVNDALVKTLTRTNTDLSQLGQAFKFVGPVAKGAGVSFNETAAAIGLLGNAGIQAGMAGTSLRGAITALLNPSSQAADIMGRLGINVKDANGELLPLNEIIEQLEQSGASTGEMMQLFGQRAGPAMMALVEQGSGALRDLTAELDNSGGTAERIAEIQMEGFNGAMTSLKSAVEGLMIAIGESGLLSAMTKFAGFLTNLARAATVLPEPLLTIGIAIGAMAAAAGPLLVISGSLIRNFVTMRTTVNALRNSKIAATIAAHGLRTAMISIPLLAVAAGALAIFSAFKKSKNAAKEFAAGVEEIANRMKQGEEPTAVATDRLKEFIDQSPRLQQALLASSFTFGEFADAAVNDMDRFNAMTDELMTLYGETFVGTIAYHNGQLATSVQETMGGFRSELEQLQGGLVLAAESADAWAAINDKATTDTGAGFRALLDISEDSLRKMREETEKAALGSEAALGALASAADVASSIIEDELAKVEKAADDLRKSVETNASAAAASFLKLSEDGKKDIDTFISDMIEGAARLTVFQDNIVAIAEATSGGFANYLMAMGVDAEKLVSDMANPAKRIELERAFKAWEITTEAAARNMGDEFAKVDPQFKKTLDGVAGMTEREMIALEQLARRKAEEVGTALMLGQVTGIANNSEAVQTAVRNAVNEAITAAMREAGIRSPSRRMADEVGKPMAQGVAVGIEEGSDEIDAAMRRTIQEALLNAAQELEKRIGDISQRTGESFFSNLIPKKEFLAPIEEVRDEVTGEIVKMGRGALSAAEVWIENMIDRTKGLSQFQDNILNIAELTSGEFGLYLLEMGMEAEDLVRDLSNPDKVAALDQAYAAWLDSTSVATRDMVSEFGKVDPGFAEVLKNLNITIEEEVKPVIETARSGGRSAGSGLVTETIRGIDEEIPNLQAAKDRYNAVISGFLPTPAFTQGGPGGLGIEGEAGLYGQSGRSLVNIQNANFSSGTDAQAVAQQIRASLGAMIPV